MRFAYIDSQGREVNIPSVDALRLRIELGAIKETTEFHDANTGKWAPAGEHEIYRTLQRELMELESGGFVPPPSVPEGTAPPVAAGRPPAPEPRASAEEPVTPPADPAPVGQEPRPPEEPAEPPPTADGPLEQTLGGADGAALADDGGLGDILLESPMDAVTSDAPPETGEGFGLEFDLGIAPDMGVVPEPEPDVPTEASSAGAPEAEGGADAPAADRGAEVPNAPAMANLEELASMELSDEWGEGDEDPASAPEMGGLELESEAGEETWSPPPPPPDTGLDLEPPMSEFDADQTADWMQDSTSVEEWAASDAPDETIPPPPPPRGEPPPRPASRPRSAPPQRKLTRARTPGIGRVIGLIFAIGAVGAGGWYVYENFLPTGMVGNQGPALPEIDAQLLPQMRQTSAAAVEATVTAMNELPTRAAIPDRPDEQWLSGRYLSTASDFPEIPVYWEAVLTFLGSVEQSDDRTFQAAFDQRLTEANLAASDAEQVRIRAMAGWEAASADRQLVYDQLRAVSNAALELHTFLLGNEEQITYTPAAGGLSGDPVLEAVPDNPAIGDAMEERIRNITLALDNLGYLETISTEGLLGAFLDKLRATPVF